MDTKKQLQTAWLVALTLGTLLIIIGILYIETSRELARLTSATHENITATRDSIREDCVGTDEASKAKCAMDLQNLSDTLTEFTKKPAGK